MSVIFYNLPVDAPLRITSKFGPRNTGISGASTYHKGIDLGRDKSKTSTDIISVAPGKIETNEWNKYRGWYVIVDHGGFKTLYQHLVSKCTLTIGSTVKTGQKLGTMGNSSDTSVLKVSVHLHFELHLNDKPIDPEPYLENIQNEEEKVEVEKIKVNMNGKETQLDAILYNNENYVKIRDLADVQTDDKFTVSWDSTNKKVVITSK